MVANAAYLPRSQSFEALQLRLGKYSKARGNIRGGGRGRAGQCAVGRRNNFLRGTINPRILAPFPSSPAIATGPVAVVGVVAFFVALQCYRFHHRCGRVPLVLAALPFDAPIYVVAGFLLQLRLATRGMYCICPPILYLPLTYWTSFLGVVLYAC